MCQASELPADNEGGLLKVLDLGIMANGLFKLKGPKMLAGDHAPNFPLKHAQKDMRFALALGDQVGTALPLAAAANAHRTVGLVALCAMALDDGAAYVCEALR